MRISIFAFGLIILLAGLAPAATAQAVSTDERATFDLHLEEAVALALRDNRELRSVRLWRVVDRFDLFLAHRAYWPSANVAVSAVRRKEASGQVNESWTFSPNLYWHSPIGTSLTAGWTRSEPIDGSGTGAESFSASVRQPLLRGAGWDVNMAPLRNAEIAAEQAKLSEENTVANLIDQVVFAYRNLIQTQERLELAQLSLARSRRLLETNQFLIDAGRMAAADIVQTQSEVANQEVALLETERTLINARAQLLSLLALDPNTPIRAIDDVEAEPVEIDPDQAVAYAMAYRRDIKAQKLGLEQARRNERLARNSRLWDVSLVAGFDRYSGIAGRDLDSHSMGLQVNIPLGEFSGRRNVMAASANLHTANLRFEGDMERIERLVRDAVADVSSRWRQLEAALRARDLARQSFELHNERLQAGRASNFEVLSLQSSLRNADAQALAARIAYANALTVLDQQMGRTLETWQISLED